MALAIGAHPLPQHARPLVSIIVPAYNAQDTLVFCLEACESQRYPNTEIIVVDDGSTDRTGAVARAFDIRFFRQSHAGPAAARNLGASVAQGDYLAFTDADCVPDPHWIERLVDAFEPGVAAVGGTYGIRNDRSWLARMIHEEIRVRHDRLGEQVDYLGSFNVMYERQAFEAQNGFDESFRNASGEDNDLAYRLHEAGGKLIFESTAAVAHKYPTKLSAYLKTQARHGYWRMKLYAKHPKRAAGDNYAGPRDLAAAGLPILFALHTVAVAAIALIRPEFRSLLITLAAYIPAFALIHADVIQDMRKRTRTMTTWPYLAVMILRDFARAAGLTAGLIRFRIMRKSN